MKNEGIQITISLVQQLGTVFKRYFLCVTYHIRIFSSWYPSIINEQGQRVIKKCKPTSTNVFQDACQNTLLKI